MAKNWKICHRVRLSKLTSDELLIVVYSRISNNYIRRQKATVLYVPVTDVNTAQNSVISVSANRFIVTFSVTLHQQACVVRMSLCVSYESPAVVYIAPRPDMTQAFLYNTWLATVRPWAEFVLTVRTTVVAKFVSLNSLRNYPKRYKYTSGPPT